MDKVVRVGNVEFRERPNTLKVKVAGGVVSGPLQHDEAAIAAGDMAIERSAENYFHWLEKDVEALVEAQAELANDPERNIASAKKVLNRAHDIRSQAGTFGYPLITQIADGLCKFIDKLDAVEPVHFEIIKTHVAALRLCQAKNLKGDGGAEGEALSTMLSKAIAKHS